jgi:hypothetical protein
MRSLLISAAIFHQHGRNRQLGEKKVKSRAEADSPLESVRIALVVGEYL